MHVRKREIMTTNSLTENKLFTTCTAHDLSVGHARLDGEDEVVEAQGRRRGKKKSTVPVEDNLRMVRGRWYVEPGKLTLYLLLHFHSDC